MYPGGYFLDPIRFLVLNFRVSRSLSSASSVVAVALFDCLLSSNNTTSPHQTTSPTLLLFFLSQRISNQAVEPWRFNSIRFSSLGVFEQATSEQEWMIHRRNR